MNTNIIQIKNLEKHYNVKKKITNIFSREKQTIKAVDNISLEIKRGEILGIAGESGSGKTTTGEMIIGLEEPTCGEIKAEGKLVHHMSRKEEKKFRKQFQMIFQDPYETLNPRFTIYRTIVESLVIHGYTDKSVQYNKVIDALEMVGLRPAEEFIYRYPHELSGGQRQRVAIARAIVLEPSFIIADEPVSMLDVSIRAGILNLLLELREKMELSMIYISHDLSTIKYLCDRIVIMYLGKIVEIGPVNKVISSPQHPYTKSLISAVPIVDFSRKRQRIKIKSEVPDQINLPKGCRFLPRCPFATEACLSCNHTLQETSEEQYSACIFTEDELHKLMKEKLFNKECN